MNRLKINVPEGFEIDKDKSTFEEIVFKPIKKELPKKWEDLGEIEGCYVNGGSEIKQVTRGQFVTNSHRNIFVTEAQAKASIALAQLSQLREVYRQGWEPDWNYTGQMKYSIIKLDGKIDSTMLWRSAHFLCFQSTEVRDQFLENFRDLIEEASPLLFG
jgi:hypothetical protein